MIKDIVEVADVQKDKIAVKFERHSACSCCSASHFCGVNNKEENLFIPRAGFILDPGDKIEVGAEEKKFLVAAIITFLLPAFLFLITLFLLTPAGEIISFLSAISFIVFYYIIVKIIIKKKGKNFNLKILRVFKKE